MTQNLGFLRNSWYVHLKYMFRIHQSVLLSHLMMMALVSLTLSACSGDGSSKKADSGMKDVFDAATGPLEDLNIKQKEIPALLQALLENPYATPKPMKCKTIKAEMAQLDELLGKTPTYKKHSSGIMNASFDDVEVPNGDELVDAGADMAHDGLMSFIHSQTDILPFRSIIRALTGADQHEKDVALAFQIGQLRRAYLKGLADNRFGPRCLAPSVIVEASAKSP